MNRLIIIGASGHGKVVADIAKRCGYKDIVFLDNNQKITSCLGYVVLGSETMVNELRGDLFVAIGNADIRKRIMEKHPNRFFPVLIHPSAVIADNVKIDTGTVVMAGTVVNPDVRIGKGCIINTSSSIDHDCVIGDYCHISVGAHLAGTVNVEEGTWIGAGSTISNNISICAGCVIGAGAVVVKSIIESDTYLGIPAKGLKQYGGTIKN